jgi:Na+/H+-dicarboxylate symporter
MIVILSGCYETVFMMDTLRSYVNSLSNCQAANIVNKWLYKIMLSPADRFAKFF